MICRKTMEACQTPNMCAPYGGCADPRERGYTEPEGYAASLRQQAKWVRECNLDGTIDADELDAAADYIQRSSEHSAAADVLERVAAANCADPANDDLTVHLAIKLAEAEQKNIDWAKGNLQRVREDVRADVLLAEAIAAERERCARIAEHDDRQMEWPRLEQDGRRMAPTARMQQAIATAIRRALVSGSTEGGNG